MLYILSHWAYQVVLVVKNLPANAGDVRDLGSIRRSGRSPGNGNGNPLQYSCLENPMDRGAWQATVYGVAQNWTWLKQFSTAWYCKETKEGFPHGSVVKNPPASAGDRFDPWVGKIPWKRKRQLSPVLLPGKSHAQRSLVDYSPWGLKESDTT